MLMVRRCGQTSHDVPNQADLPESLGGGLFPSFSSAVSAGLPVLTAV
jgi:hypothetical protein